MNRSKLYLILVALATALILGYGVYQSGRFHVVNTNPKTTQVAGISPFFNISFNKDLSDKNLSLAMTPNAISSYHVDGKILYIDLITPLALNQKYKLTIKSIYASTGEQIINKSLPFTPKDIAFENLPKDQQDAILKQSPPKADQNAATNFGGLSAFIDNGLSSDQVNALIKAFNKFSPNAKSVTVDQASLSPGPHDPNKNDPFTINFNLVIDSTSYKGTVSYQDLKRVRLYLYDPQSGGQIFDSGAINP